MRAPRWWPRGTATSPRSTRRSPSSIPKAGTPTTWSGTRSITGPSSSASPCCARRSAWSPPGLPGCPRRRDERFDAADHLMTYLFTGLAAMDDFNALSARGAMRAGRPTSSPWWSGPPTASTGCRQRRASRWRRRVALVARQGRLHPGGARRGARPGSRRRPGVGRDLVGRARPLDRPFCSRDNGGLHLATCSSTTARESAGGSSPVRAALVGEGGPAVAAAPFHSLVAYDSGRYSP